MMILCRKSVKLCQKPLKKMHHGSLQNMSLVCNALFSHKTFMKIMTCTVIEKFHCIYFATNYVLVKINYNISFM